MMSEKSLIEMMEIVAGGLGDLLERVVFVGGATTPLYYEDAAATRIRPTTDVECLVEIVSRGSTIFLRMNFAGSCSRMT